MFSLVVRNFFYSTMIVLFLVYSLPSFAIASAKTFSEKKIITTTKETRNRTADRSWIHLSSSFRPAYVGIHGGTAPVTLLRDADGSVYAITGQTGNDFIVAIRSRNSSEQKKQEVIDLKKDPITQSAQKTPTTDAYFVSFMSEYQKASDAIYSRWSDSKQWIAMIKASANTYEQDKKVLDEIIDPKPENYPSIVFASGKDMNQINRNAKEFSSFGLSDDDMPLATNLNGAQTPMFAPLELSDYRNILRSLL